jgi:hypothetical protein
MTTVVVITARVVVGPGTMATAQPQPPARFVTKIIDHHSAFAIIINEPISQKMK